MFVVMEDLEKKANRICECYHLPISVFLADCFVNKKLQDKMDKAKDLQKFVCNTYCDDLVRNHREIYEDYYISHDYLNFLQSYAKVKGEDFVSLANKVAEYNLRQYDVA